MRNPTSFLVPPVVCLVALHAHRASAKIYTVVPDVSSSDVAGEVYSLPDALEEAEGGDTISLQPGTYTDRIRSTGPGEDGNPITIVGTREAVLKATSPCVDITHSWITLEVSTAVFLGEYLLLFILCVYTHSCTAQ